MMEVLLFVCGFACGVVFIATIAVAYVSDQIKRENEKKRAARKRFKEFDVAL